MLVNNNSIFIKHRRHTVSVTLVTTASCACVQVVRGGQGSPPGSPSCPFTRFVTDCESTAARKRRCFLQTSGKERHGFSRCIVMIFAYSSKIISSEPLTHSWIRQLSSALEEYFCASVAMSTENCKGVAPLALCSWTEREILSTLCVLTWVIIILPDTAYTFTIALLITIPSSN